MPDPSTDTLRSALEELLEALDMHVVISRSSHLSADKVALLDLDDLEAIRAAQAAAKTALFSAPSEPGWEAQRDEALKWLSGALTGHIGPGIPAGPQTFSRGEMADLEAALAALSGDTRPMGA